MRVVHEVGAAGLDVTVNVSVAKLPVSMDVLINKLPEVLLYVPSAAAVTVTAIVHVPKPATVILENESAVSPTVNEAGEGEPQPV